MTRPWERARFDNTGPARVNPDRPRPVGCSCPAIAAPLRPADGPGPLRRQEVQPMSPSTTAATTPGACCTPMPSAACTPSSACGPTPADPRHLGAETGFLAVLQTRGANLSYHPHLHCVVPGGRPSPAGSACPLLPPRKTHLELLRKPNPVQAIPMAKILARGLVQPISCPPARPRASRSPPAPDSHVAAQEILCNFS